jgi:hypothetical protein
MNSIVSVENTTHGLDDNNFGMCFVSTRKMIRALLMFVCLLLEMSVSVDYTTGIDEMCARRKC